MAQGHSPTSRRVCVVGGGITALSAAYYLLRYGQQNRQSFQITILEAEHRLGGKLRTERDRGLTLELGPDSLLKRKPWAVELIDQLGLTGDLVASHASTRKMYVTANGNVEPLPEGLLMGAPVNPAHLLSSRILSWPGKLRALLEPLLPPKAVDEDETLAAFARRRLGEEAARKLLEPLLKAPYAGRAAELSLMATYPGLRELERRYGSLTDAVRQGYRPGEGAFVTLRQGLEHLVQQLVAELSRSANGQPGQSTVEIKTGLAATRVVPKNGRCYRVAAREAGKPEELTEDFDAVIITTPAFVTAEILESFLSEAANVLAAIPYASVGIVGFAFHRSQISHPLDGSGLLVPEDSPLILSGCTWLSSKWPHSCPEDTALIRCFHKLEPGVTTEAAINQVLDEISSLLGIKGKPYWIRSIQWTKAIPQYTLGHLKRVDLLEKLLAPYPGLLLAGAALKGIGIPDCVRQGRDAAAQLANNSLSSR